ncbi:MAG TPA: diacylglycerol kinase family protein [Pseudonocardiaceae bacterium]
MHQPTVRRAASTRQIDIREVHAGYRADALARDAVAESAQALVAAGGDGTVSAVARVASSAAFPDRGSLWHA